jgi:hypothetical protein
MEMQSILATLTARRNQLVEQNANRPRGAAVDLVLVARIDLLATAIASLHHYDAPEAEIRKALSL